MNLVLMGSFCAANRMASAAVFSSTPSISKRMRPGLTTAIQPSGAPLPLPIRVSAGFLVTGLSGNRRIQILPPRFTKRVMATRLASIWRSVIQPGSSTFSPYSPKASSEPRQALPAMRPRCCLRYFTFLGINIKSALRYQSVTLSLRRSKLRLYTTPLIPAHAASCPLQKSLECASHCCGLRFALLLRQNFATVDPAFHPDYAVGGFGLGETVFDVGAQRVQRQAALQIPLGTRDFVAVQPAADANLDSLAAEAQGGIYRLPHGAAEADTLFELQRDRLRHQLRIKLGFVHFLDIDVDLARSALLHVLLELVDFSALAPDDNARTRRFDDDAQFVARALDFDRADAGGLKLILQLVLQLYVFQQQLVVITFDKPTRFPRLGVAEAKTIWVDFLSHCFSLS